MSNTKEKNISKVSVFIPRRFKGDDVRTVSVNGRYKQIPTGKHFEVERAFAEVIENALLADDIAERNRQALARG